MTDNNITPLGANPTESAEAPRASTIGAYPTFVCEGGLNAAQGQAHSALSEALMAVAYQAGAHGESFPLDAKVRVDISVIVDWES